MFQALIGQDAIIHNPSIADTGPAHGQRETKHTDCHVWRRRKGEVGRCHTTWSEVSTVWSTQVSVRYGVRKSVCNESES